MKFYINVEYKKCFYRVFTLGYTSDGGFFVNDVLSKNGDKQYAITKMLIPGAMSRNFGVHRIPMDKCENWVARNCPKLTHHADGVVQVSGTGITSGFYKFFKGHKGVSTKAMNLRKRNNDGGPILIFHLKRASDLHKKNKKGVMINRADQIIDPYLRPSNEEYYSFSLELYYLPKEVITRSLNIANGTFSYRHPNYGIVPLKYVPAPKHSPGVIGIFTRISTREEAKGDFLFSINGGASIVQNENGEEEHISIVYPHNVGMRSKTRPSNRLDFEGMNWLIAQLDFLLHRLKSFFKV